METRLLQYFLFLSRNRMLWQDIESFDSGLSRKPIFLTVNLHIHGIDTGSFEGYSGHNKYMLP